VWTRDHSLLDLWIRGLHHNRRLSKIRFAPFVILTSLLSDSCRNFYRLFTPSSHLGPYRGAPQAVVTYHRSILGEDIKKPEARQMMLTKEQFIAVHKEYEYWFHLRLSTLNLFLLCVKYLMTCRCVHGGAPRIATPGSRWWTSGSPPSGPMRTTLLDSGMSWWQVYRTIKAATTSTTTKNLLWGVLELFSEAGNTFNRLG
jgi:hypothetical protein